jgi:hypothetical protein
MLGDKQLSHNHKVSDLAFTGESPNSCPRALTYDRFFDDANNASIGLVWHRHLIDECLRSLAQGSRDWIPSHSIKLFAPLKKSEESGPPA